VFVSNHFHLIAGFPTLSRRQFMEEFTGQVSDRLNSHRDRSGSMFPDRYDAQVLCDDQMIRDKICYVLNNPVKDGLVATPDAWPGVSSFEHHASGDALEGHWLNHDTWTKLSRRKTSDHQRSEAMEKYEVPLYVPEALEGESDDERRASLCELVEEDKERIHDEATEELGCPPKFMGPADIRARNPRSRPIDSDIDRRGRSSRRLFASSEPGGAAARREKHRQRTLAYRAAVDALHNGDPGQFPHGMHPPATVQCVGQSQAWHAYHASTDD
jgi:hypothetical protein